MSSFPFKRVLITGGAGFVGSNIAIALKERFSGPEIIVMDSLKRSGAELNLGRFRKNGITFAHGDIRSQEDLEAIGRVDLVIDCSAEPSVLAGYTQTPRYIINTNLYGTVNCLEKVRKEKAHFLFISTSRIYPIDIINSLKYSETPTRFVLRDDQDVPGVCSEGISEKFMLGDTSRSLYGATKLSSELLLREYMEMGDVKAIINRCGVIAGPWQMGKVDQGVIALWVARHLFGRPLKYIGFGGKGKQVRDIIHVDDVIELVCSQLTSFDLYGGESYNVGGGKSNSVSLQELTTLCQNVLGKKVPISHEQETRPGDIMWYITNASKIIDKSGWSPKKNLEDIIEDISQWVANNRELLEHIL